MSCNPSNIIVLVINCLQGGGAEKSVLTLAEGFYQLGYKVHVIRFKATTEYELSPHIDFHIVNFKWFKLIPSDKLRYQQFAKHLDNYILTHIGQPCLTIANLERADKVLSYSQLPNVIHVIRNTLSQELKLAQARNKPIDIAQLKTTYHAQPCVAISEGVAVDFKATLGLTNITTIYNPIDNKLIEAMAETYPLEIAEFIVHVGSFKYQKAHDILLKAYAKTSQRYPLYLVGQGKLMAETKQLAVDLGISDKVVFIGFKSNPYPYIKHAKCLVLSSRFEGFGRVIAEALAVDTPVISTDCPYGPSELLPRQNLVPVDDIDALAQLLEQAMANPSAFAVPFDERFLPKNIANQYIERFVTSNLPDTE